MSKRFLQCTCLVFLVVFSAQRAKAVVFPYGNFVGDTVTYLDVTEDTRDLAVALFGAPAISGDRLDFDPLSFTASAGNGASSQITDGQLNFTLMTNDISSGINMVTIEEAGDYTLVGPPAAFSEVNVGTLVRFTVTHVNGVQASVPNGSEMMLFDPNASGAFAFPGDAGTALPWNGHLDLDIAAFLASEGISGHATKVEFTIDNTLTATASGGGSAFVAKKDFNGVSITVAPEPTSLVLLMPLLVALGMLRRR